MNALPNAIQAVVHPLFGSMFARSDSNAVAKADQRALLARYNEKAFSLKANELAVVIPSISQTEMETSDSVVARGVRDIVAKIRSDRLILLFDPFAECTDTDHNRSHPRFEELKTKLADKGVDPFAIDEMVICGESFNVCVHDFASAALREMPGLSPVTIDVHATNAGVKFDRSDEDDRRSLHEALTERNSEYAVFASGIRYDLSRLIV